MIIPPDPEKDPNIFDPSASAPSLVPLSTVEEDEVSSTSGEITRPRPAHTTNHAFGYPFGDDLGFGYSGEQLPPYERQRMEGEIFADPSTSRSISMRERSTRTHIARPSLVIPNPSPDHRQSPLTSTEDALLTASSSTARLPLTNPSSTPSKNWEGSLTNWSEKHRSKHWRKWWKKWKKWVYLAFALLIAGIGVLVGVLVGLKAGKTTPPPTPPSSPWQDNDGKSAWVTVSPPGMF